MIEYDDLDNFFRYHRPTVEQQARYQKIRDAGKNLATVILQSTPSSPEQTVAVRRVREAVMYANSAIACYEAEETDD